MKPEKAREAITTALAGDYSKLVKGVSHVLIKELPADKASLDARGISSRTNEKGELLVTVNGVEMREAVARKLGYV
jgi:hypothetical protein